MWVLLNSHTSVAQEIILAFTAGPGPNRLASARRAVGFHHDGRRRGPGRLKRQAASIGGILKTIRMKRSGRGAQPQDRLV